MKKLLLILVMAAASFQVFADGQFILQGMAMNTTRVTEGTFKYERNFTSWGLNFINFKNDFSNLGFYSNVSFLLPVTYTATENGQNLVTDISMYDSMVIDLDMIVGPGYDFELGALNVLLGGGVHFNGIAMMAKSYSIDPYLSYVIGIGAAATAKYNLTENFSLTATLQGGYDFYELFRIPDLATGYKTTANLTYAAGLGLGFKY